MAIVVKFRLPTCRQWLGRTRVHGEEEEKDGDKNEDKNEDEEDGEEGGRRREEE